VLRAGGMAGIAQLAYPGLLRRCEAPRPSCVRLFDFAKWAQHPWRYLSCGAAIDPSPAEAASRSPARDRRSIAAAQHCAVGLALGPGSQAPGLSRLCGSGPCGCDASKANVQCCAAARGGRGGGEVGGGKSQRAARVS